MRKQQSYSAIIIIIQLSSADHNDALSCIFLYAVQFTTQIGQYYNFMFAYCKKRKVGILRLYILNYDNEDTASKISLNFYLLVKFS